MVKVAGFSNIRGKRFRWMLRTANHAVAFPKLFTNFDNHRKTQKMRIFIPLVLAFLFVSYVLYLAFVKREFRRKWRTEVLPGACFLFVWGLFYVTFLR